MPKDFWLTSNIFDLRESSFLLAGLPPQDGPLPPTVKAARRQLDWEVKCGRLSILHQEVNGPPLVRREDLRATAERLGHRPLTLFPEDRQPPSVELINSKERRVWATLVKLLLLDMKTEIDLAKPYKAAQVLRVLAAQHDLRTWPMDDETIATKLKQAQEAEQPYPIPQMRNPNSD